MFEAIVLGGLMRIAQAFLQASPFLLCGLLIAAVFRRLLGVDGVRKLFGEGTWRSLPQAWLVGMALPVCSLGVIPVAREMRRAGLSGGTILAFALAAPLFNPLSVLYGLTLSRPGAIFVFALGSLVVVTAAGLLWDAIFKKTSLEPTSEPPLAWGLKRLCGLVTAGAYEITGATAGYIAVGLSGVFLLAAVLPPGSLQDALGRDGWTAPLLMTVVATPVYAAPMTAMSQLGIMFQHGNSIAAAFALLSLGAGINLGVIAWICRNYGIVRGLTWFGMLVAVVLALGYGIDRPLRSADIADAAHTHAFDVYTRPFDPADDYARKCWQRFRQGLLVHEEFSTVAIAAWALFGLALRAFDPKGRLDAWLRKPPEAAPEPGKYDIVLPPSVLGGATLCVLVALSVVGCYTYYPPPDVVLEEMNYAKAEAVTGWSSDAANTERWVGIYTDWVKRLQVGYFLRNGELDEFKRVKCRLLLDRLEA
ncbi:MAG: permease, partial [Planctomycetota bacterium]